MSDAQPQPPKDQAPPAPDTSLEDIDKLLESEDPEFTKSLEEVRAVESDKDVVIDASAIDESLDGAENPQDAATDIRGLARVKLFVRGQLNRFSSWSKTRSKQAGKDFVEFLKVRPKQFALWSFKMLKAGAKNAMVPVKTFQEATRAQQLAVVILLGLSFASAWVLLANFKGIWLPQINEPMLQSLESFADVTETYNPKQEGESFYSAFPQERHEFLFPKMKVNLRRTSGNPNPMGAFEIVVLLDSKDTAIEVADRKVEFGDLLQRTIEEESFNDLETELGKSKLKSHLKRELNQKLTQGWAKDISFKTFIMKP